MTDGDRAAVDAFRAHLAERARALAVELGGHVWELLAEDRAVGMDHRRCTACGVTVTRWWGQRAVDGGTAWADWLAPDGRTWRTTPGGYVEPPSCPLPVVEAVCPWEPDAKRYAGVTGDLQLAAAERTWCARHECAVSECPEPGPPCPGALAHEDGEPGRPGPCGGRELYCRCMCPACCGDTPDVWGAPVY